MKRSTLLVGGVVVLAAVLVLVWKLRGGDDAADASTSTASTPSPSSSSSSGHASGTQVADRGSPASAHTAQPALPATADGSDDNGVRTYTVGGFTVRDHRRGRQDQMDIPPSLHPPGSRHLKPALVTDVANKVRDAVADCAKAIPAEQRGQNPKMEGQVIIAIDNHQVSVKSSIVQLRDVVGASLDPVKQCMSDKIAQLGTPAPNEDDLASYSLNLSFVIL